MSINHTHTVLDFHRKLPGPVHTYRRRHVLAISFFIFSITVFVCKCMCVAADIISAVVLLCRASVPCRVSVWFYLFSNISVALLRWKHDDGVCWIEWARRGKK